MSTLLPPALTAEADASAAPAVVTATLLRLRDTQPAALDRLEADAELRAATVAVAAASDYLGRLIVNDPHAFDILLGAEPSVSGNGGGPPPEPEAIARWKRRGILRIAAADLLGHDDLEHVGASLADLADALCRTACAGPPRALASEAAPELAVIGMGKLGARELNYGSDVDLLLVGDGDPRELLALVRAGWRVDLDLRPEGRDGPLVRSLGSYQAYWDRWADVWEFQALLKARHVAGDPDLGAAFLAEAAARVWTRPLDAGALRRVRSMKARAEQQVLRRGNDDRDIKTGRGGIRDIEFAAQLLQLVHGPSDPTLRVPATLPALAALAAGGYIASDDASTLSGAYRFLRTVEHRLQLVEDTQTHVLPRTAAALERLARVLGFRDVDQFERVLRRYRYQVRAVHERLFFRPLLEAFAARPDGLAGSAASATPDGLAGFARSTSTGAVSPAGAGSTASATPDRPAGSAASALTPEAAADRLSAFGFTDADRTRAAIRELTGGFSRTSRLMEQLLPHVLDWLSQAPDPDLGLLGLRSLVEQPHRRVNLTTAFRDSPEAARQLCTLLGTGPGFARGFSRHPELLGGLADGSALAARSRADLDKLLDATMTWRPDATSRAAALRGFVSGQRLRVEARDVLAHADVVETGRSLTDLAEATLDAALSEVGPQVPLALIAMGRFGGAELAYSSDLDVLVVFDGTSPAATAAADDAASGLWKLINGETPALRIFTLDAGLRPEGRQGPLARSLAAFATYYERWARVWERQALLRGRFAAGDPDVGRAFADVARRFVWETPFGPEEVREIRRLKARMETERIPAGEDPQFHLKLGRGSLSDVEWTAQLLQLRAGTSGAGPLPGTGTVQTLETLSLRGLLDEADRDVLISAYRFCEAARNRLSLIRGAPLDALPAAGHDLRVLAHSLGTSPSGLREEYRRVTRRARRVMERLFYGNAAAPRGS